MLKALMASGEYEKFVDTHYHREWNPRAHNSVRNDPAFMPWHRAYLFEFENAVRRETGSCFTIAYWDWRVDNFAGNQIPTIVSDMGGEANCVFPQDEWNYACDEVYCASQSSRRCLRRQPGWWRQIGSLCGPATLQNGIVQATTFVAADSHIQGTCHSMPHMFFSGDMGTHQSPFDPLFWSHHAMVDYSWHMWQECHSNSHNTFISDIGGFANQVLPGFGSDKVLSSVDRAYTYAETWDIQNFATYQPNPNVDMSTLNTCSGRRELFWGGKSNKIFNAIKKATKKSFQSILKDIKNAGISVDKSFIKNKARAETFEALAVCKKMPGSAAEKFAALLKFECSKMPKRFVAKNGAHGEIAQVKGHEANFHQTYLC